MYILFLGIDANFRLRRKMVSNRFKDPALSEGNAYFVDDDPFQGFLKTGGNDVEQTVRLPFLSPGFCLSGSNHRRAHVLITTQSISIAKERAWPQPGSQQSIVFDMISSVHAPSLICRREKGKNVP